MLRKLKREKIDSAPVAALTNLGLNGQNDKILTIDEEAGALDIEDDIREELAPDDVKPPVLLVDELCRIDVVPEDGTLDVAGLEETGLEMTELLPIRPDPDDEEAVDKVDAVRAWAFGDDDMPLLPTLLVVLTETVDEATVDEETTVDEEGTADEDVVPDERVIVTLL